MLRELREQNVPRMMRWHGDDGAGWTGADWSNAMCGEAGEAANIVKKIRRHETGLGSSANTPPIDELIAKLGTELADIVAYVDLLAAHYDIDLERAVAEKFNEVSEINGFPERLEVPA
jgi:NTP pyrophosphatase (non-canonical NTP hydrolase)